MIHWNNKILIFFFAAVCLLVSNNILAYFDTTGYKVNFNCDIIYDDNEIEDGDSILVSLLNDDLDTVFFNKSIYWQVNLRPELKIIRHGYPNSLKLGELLL